ncbi:DNA-3-methyladenine glycosylase I [Atopobacter phocae]|uniref:DNA-3-methyladenine glycosylase I n=1 Tax=Atopobacter phocae TaxID=136492 RepID=UPI00046FD87F|nr:DNA-3-methyladenine glycosylase I [Atopobacter phocae]
MIKIDQRCDWALNSCIEQDYHDHIWGKPEHDDRQLFKMLILEGMQAGLNWRTILVKMNAFEEAFDQFNPHEMARYDQDKEASLLNNRSIIRHRLKIASLKYNAQAYLKVVEEFGSFNAYIWRFVDNKPVINHWKTSQEVPAKTPLSKQISDDLKKRGFKFVGPTIVYSFMQATGMVNDHLITCPFR